MKSITVVTPTYNRKKTLVNCFESLKNQSRDDFIWHIVDDGSTDGTEQLVREWQKTYKWIYYTKKMNGGKASALNLSSGTSHLAA